MGCYPSRARAVAPAGSDGKVNVVQVQQPKARSSCAAGCGKPTWNGKVGEYCSKACRSGSSPSAICATPGCGKPSWNGQPGEYCTKFCKAGVSRATCLTPGCGKPTWNGDANQYCSKACKVGLATPGQLPPLSAAPFAPEPCANPECTQPSWNGQPGEYCSKFCRDGVNPVAPGGSICQTLGCGKPTWNGLPGEYCSKACKGPGGRGRSSCTLLQPGTHKYESMKKQYTDKWDTGRCQPTPIRAIYEVNCRSDLFDAFSHHISTIGNVKCFGHGTNPGNVQRRFHGTRMTCRPGDPWTACSDSRCSCCRIIEDGFNLGRLGSWSGNQGHYGGGLYFTSMSSTAKGYGMASGYAFDKGNWMDPSAGNVVLIVNIACGRVENVKSTCTHHLDTSQFESRKVDKPSGADELIVFDPGQTLVRAIIVF